MRDELIRIPKEYYDSLRRAREKQVKLSKQGIKVTVFDLMIQEHKNSEGLDDLFKGFKL